MNVEDKGSGLISARRHPIVYIVEAADDICYISTDLEDAFRIKEDPRVFDVLKRLAGIDGSFPDSLTDEQDKMAYARSKAIDRMIDAVVNKIGDGTYKQWGCPR